MLILSRLNSSLAGIGWLPADREADAGADLAILVETLGDAGIDGSAVADHRAHLQRRGLPVELADRLEDEGYDRYAAAATVTEA